MVFLSERMFNKKGQAVIETLIILAIAVFILTVITSLVYTQMTNDFASQQQKQGYSVVQSLSKEINDAYFLGPGTVREVVITLPQLVDLNKSYISGSTLVLNVGGNNFTSSTDVNIIGSWPNTDGSNVFTITVFDNFVSLSVGQATFSPPEITQVLAKNSSADVNIAVSNATAGDLSYLVVPNMSGHASVAFSQTNPFFVLEGQSKEITFSLSCDVNSYGSYSGEIIFSPQYSADSNLKLPVSITCSSVHSKLNIFPSSIEISVFSDSTDNNSVLVCNSSSFDYTSASSSISGAAANYISASFSGTLPANSCKSLALSINSPSQTGTFPGKLIVNAGGFTATTDLNLLVAEGNFGEAALECANNLNYDICGYSNTNWIYFDGQFYNCGGDYPNCTASIRPQQEPNYCGAIYEQCAPGERFSCAQLDYYPFYESGPGSDIVCDNDCRFDTQLGSFCDVPATYCSTLGALSCEDYNFVGTGCGAVHPDCNEDSGIPMDFNSCFNAGCRHSDEVQPPGPSFTVSSFSTGGNLNGPELWSKWATFTLKNNLAFDVNIVKINLGGVDVYQNSENYWGMVKVTDGAVPSHSSCSSCPPINFTSDEENGMYIEDSVNHIDTKFPGETYSEDMIIYYEHGGVQGSFDAGTVSTTVLNSGMGFDYYTCE